MYSFSASPGFACSKYTVARLARGWARRGSVGGRFFCKRAEHLLEHPGGFGVAAQRLMGAGEVVQRRNVGEIIGAATLGGGLGFLGLCERGRIVPGRIEILKALLRGGDVDLLRHGLQWRG